MPLQFAKETVYSLKNRYGIVADLYDVTDQSVDPETGETVVTREKYRINKAILLPSMLVRQIFTRPGRFEASGFEITDTFLIIDHADLPSDVTIDTLDYIIIQHKRYNIGRVEEFEQNIASIISMKHVGGVQKYEIHDGKIRQQLTITQAVSFTKV